MRTLPFFCFLIGCKANYIPGEIEAPTDDTGEIEDTSEWDGAWMEVISPQSGDFLPLGEDATFEAIIYDINGEPTAFSEVNWVTDLDEAWSLEGSEIDDSSLDVGTHAISAAATLPNGDRLVHTMGGILVQHEDAGTYVGNVQVDLTLDYDGSDYSAGCTGSVTLIVDAWGETASGDSACTVSLLGYDQDTTYLFDLSLEDDELSGIADVDLTFFTYSFDVNGEVNDGELSGTWEDEVFGYIALAGELSVSRITRDIGE